MKNFLTVVAISFLSMVSMNAMAASKYQIKVGSWLDAYVSQTSCKNHGKTDCTMANLAGCSGGPANVYMTKRNADAVNKSVSNGSSVKVFDRTQNAEVCSF